MDLSAKILVVSLSLFLFFVASLFGPEIRTRFVVTDLEMNISSAWLIHAILQEK